ncbi:MAG: radical SAM protein, partial [Lachnospiraceae bacterium]|nr:radical SAM protein [Lachnospiraceae bacterium]
MNITNPYRQYMYSYPHKTAYRHLNGISLEDYASCLAGPGHGLYLHLPFCRTKCGYCNLFSVTGLERDPLQ